MAAQDNEAADAVADAAAEPDQAVEPAADHTVLRQAEAAFASGDFLITRRLLDELADADDMTPADRQRLAELRLAVGEDRAATITGIAAVAVLIAIIAYYVVM